MSNDVLLAKINKLFVNKLNVEIPANDTDLFEEGFVDSLALVTLLFELEQEFEIQIDMEDLDFERLRCINQIADFIGRN